MERLQALFTQPPKTPWQAILTQLFLLSFRRFCVDRLSEETTSDTLWENRLELMVNFAPSHFRPHFDDWLRPETIAQIPKIDEPLRELVHGIDKAVAEDNDEMQDLYASILDSKIHGLLRQWLGERYAGLLFFPSDEESETDTSLLQFVLLRLHSYAKRLKKTVRVKGRRSLTPIRSQMKKTRKSKQNEGLSVSLGPNAPDKQRQSQEDDSERQERQGVEGCHAQDEGKADHAHGAAHEGGGEEHSQPPVHAVSVPVLPQLSAGKDAV